MNKLNEKIAKILKQHPEGEEFFDALDAMVRGDLDILTAFLSFVENRVEYGHTLILTGKFGIAIMNTFRSKLSEIFSDIILVNGGIRKGEEPIIYREGLSYPKCILLDDSYYSGTTKNKIEEKLKEIDEEACIEKTFVIYDGSRTIQPNLFSMFRYHKESKPLWEEELLEL